MQEDRPESEFHSDSDESFDSDPLTREDIAAVVAKMEERAFKGRIHLIWRRKPLPRHHYPCPEKIVTSSGRFLKYQEQLVLQLDEFQEVGKVATYHPFPNLEEIDYLDIQLRQEAASVIRGVDIVLATDIREAQRVRPAKRPRADVTPTQVGMEAARTDREPPPAAAAITNVTATPSDWARFADVEDNRAAKKELLTLAQSGTLKVPLEVPAHYVACYVDTEASVGDPEGSPGTVDRGVGNIQGLLREERADAIGQGKAGEHDQVMCGLPEPWHPGKLGRMEQPFPTGTRGHSEDPGAPDVGRTPGIHCRKVQQGTRCQGDRHHRNRGRSKHCE